MRTITAPTAAAPTSKRLGFVVHVAQTACAFLFGLIALHALAGAPGELELPNQAFVPPAPCEVDPFAIAGVDQREATFELACGADDVRLRLQAPTANPSERLTQPARIEAEQWLNLRFDDFSTNLRLSWTGSSDALRTRLESARTLLAAGSAWRLSDDLAVEVNVGRQRLGVAETRATFTGSWRSPGEHLLFVTWADSDFGSSQSMGLRWWLAPGRVAFDIAARRDPEGILAEPRLALSVFEFIR